MSLAIDLEMDLTEAVSNISIRIYTEEQQSVDCFTAELTGRIRV
jgi:hypothetical protein